MVTAALLLALAQPAEPVPVCSLVAPGGQNVGFFIGGDDRPDNIRLSAAPGSAWPGATLRAARVTSTGSNLHFAIGGEDGLTLELGNLVVGRTQRPVTLFRRERGRSTLPLAFGYCEDRPVSANAPEPSATPAALGLDNPAFDAANWPDDCAMLLSDGRRIRFTFRLTSETQLTLGSQDLWPGREVATDIRWQPPRGSVQLATFGRAGGPEGVQMMFVAQPLAVKLIRFRAFGEPSAPSLTGYGICGVSLVERRPVAS